MNDESRRYYFGQEKGLEDKKSLSSKTMYNFIYSNTNILDGLSK